MNDIREYQKRCFKSYKKDISYPDITYYYGNPVNAIVPIETAKNGVMVIGAYPTAKFGDLNSIRDIPLYDISAPFSNEYYFSGSSIRSVLSGEELEDHYLSPLGINRANCWITNLVKVFLFKDGHVSKYKQLSPVKYEMIQSNRNQFNVYATLSKKYILEEIEIAKPKIIICLGVEVGEILLGISKQKAKDYMDGVGRIYEAIGDIPVMVFPHPGIIMRGERSKWPNKLKYEIIPTAKSIIENIYKD